MAKQTSLIGTSPFKRHAWAIELIYKHQKVPRQHWAGVFNWIGGGIPGCMEGSTTALFATRADARKARASLWSWPNRKAVVRKVEITITRVPERPNDRPARREQ
jgi:hypothetical protein